jgi:hypothetical protein
MGPRFHTPRELVEALQARAPGARAQFGQLIQAPLGALMAQFIRRHGLDNECDLLTVHALHAAENHVRGQGPASFADMTWAAFRGAVLLHVARIAFQPYGAQADLPDGRSAGPPPLPESPLYASRTFFRPYERLGAHWFGGDWFAGHLTPDGAFWVLLADITGHGYFAYLLACGLPDVWERCWRAQPPAPQPAEVLLVMHHLLADCLPDGIFLECVLARLGPDGSVTVAPAGGMQLLLRRNGACRAEVQKLRGMWLGLGPPSVEDQRRWRLGQGDELLLATDGVFDQLSDDGEAEALTLPVGPGTTLFDVVHERLREALAQGPQRDDMTMVLLRRRARAEGEGSPVRPEAPAHNGAGDVPV